MRSVDEHLDEILRTVEPLHPLPLTLSDAHGCVLAEDVVSTGAIPPFDNSAMDGYAVRQAEVAAAPDASPVQLHVSGDPRRRAARRRSCPHSAGTFLFIGATSTRHALRP